MAKALTPEMVADRWECSTTHVRALVKAGTLRGFRLGPKLIRIPIDAVEEYEKCQSVTGSEGSTGDGSLQNTTEKDAASGGLTYLRTMRKAEGRAGKPRTS